MTSSARALRITSGSLGLALLMLTAGPHSVARAQHGAQIEKSCVNAARRACLQGTTAGCPGINAGATCQTAADCQLPSGGVQAVCIGGATTAGMDCAGSSCSSGSTCMGGIQAGLPCPTRPDCPNGSCFDCIGGGVCQVSPHCELAPTQLCMSQDDCAPAGGRCVVVLGRAGDAVNV